MSAIRGVDLPRPIELSEAVAKLTSSKYPGGVIRNLQTDRPAKEVIGTLGRRSMDKFFNTS
jgi:hypothetical protein